MENGLPQNTVQTIAQTSDGFVWLGTEVGLVRFDGNSFVLFDQNSKPALAGNDVSCLLAASDGALWIGTSDGLARLQNGSVTTFTTANGLPANSIRSLRQGPNETVVVTTQNSKVAIDGARVVPVQFDNSDNLYAGPLTDGFSAIVLKTTIQISQNGHPHQTWTVGKDIPGTRIQTAYADRQGALWIGTNGGLVRYSSGKIDRLPVTDPLATASILSTLEDHEGNIWVGTETGGLHILRDERFRTYGTRDGLSSDAATTVVEDNAGMLWVGTGGSGLDAISPQGKHLQQGENLDRSRRAFEQCYSFARCGTERRPVGRHSRRVEPRSLRNSRLLHISRRVAGRLHPLSAGRCRWFSDFTRLSLSMICLSL